MRKLVVSMWITLDGFVAGADDSMDWLRIDDQMMDYENSFVNNADTLMLGRVTFGDFAGYWPTVARDGRAAERERSYARRLDELKKIVISETDDIPVWKETKRFSSIDKQTILSLKEQPGKNIVIYGSLSIINALTDMGLIDEYHLLMHPIYLRKGKPLFKENGSSMNLELLSSEVFHSGVTLMKFRPAQ